MTEDDQDLLERIEAIIANAWDEDEHETLSEARDRIQALSAENERLQRSAEYWEQDAKRYAANQEHWRMEERAAILTLARSKSGPVADWLEELLK